MPGSFSLCWRQLLSRLLKYLLISVLIILMYRSLLSLRFMRNNGASTSTILTKPAKESSLPAVNLTQDSNEGFLPGRSNVKRLPVLFRDVFPDPSAFNIYFVETSKADQFPHRMICAVESFCRLHPEAVVWLFVTTDHLILGERLQTVQETYANLRLVYIDIDLALHGTPMLDVYHSDKIKGFVVANLSDLLRLALLHKLGGIYADTDIIALRSMTNIQNTLGYQDPRHDLVNGALVIIDRGHPFLAALMEDVVENFNGTAWGHNGPDAITRTLRKLHCDLEEKKPRRDTANEEISSRGPSRTGPCNLTLAPMASFYPVPLWNLFKNDKAAVIEIEHLRRTGRGKRLPESGNGMPEIAQPKKGLQNGYDEILKLLEEVFPESFSVHLYNKMTSQIPIALGSLIDRMSTIVCPATRRLGAL